MADSENGRSSFCTQANALFRKNLTFQRRNCRANIRLVLFPLLLCLLLVLIQLFVNEILDKPSGQCICNCVDQNGDGTCQTVCDIPNLNSERPADCPVPSPPEWPPMLQIPSRAYRAAEADFLPFGDLPNDSCRSKWDSCPATILLTGMDHSLGESLGRYIFPNPARTKLSRRDLADLALGSATKTQFPDPAFADDLPIYYLQSECGANSTLSISTRIASEPVKQEIRCLQSLQLWRNSSSDINEELYKGYMKGNSEGRINEILAAYDLLNSNMNNYNVTIWYNSTDEDGLGNDPSDLLRVPRSLNMVSNAFLQLLLGPSAKIQFEFVKEMPKHETQLRLDLSSLLGPMFYTWVILQLFPVVLSSLVYEKQQNLRIMMKMHGLGDGAYLMISYAYFLLLSSVYLFVFVLFGSVIGLKFFTLNSYSIQLVFYFIYANLQISSAFLFAALFSNVKTATVLGYILVFGTGLLGGYLFQFLLQQKSLSRGWLVVLQLYPGFSLYRGLYEFSEYAFAGNLVGTDGMRWGDLSDSSNGMRPTLILMVVEWLVVVFVAYYIDQVWSSGSGVRRSPLFFLDSFKKKLSLSSRKPSLCRQGSKVFVQLEKPDVGQERERVEQLLLESETSHGIICDDLKKVYPGRDGNPEKFAVRGLSLALAQGECFGMLGPNGAGKTTFINMMTGLMKPSSGVAFVYGLDIRTSMDDIYSNMGVCPQHDLLWETLTGREHLLFYGRLKNLKGAALTHAVDESLKSVNLFNGGVADRQAGKYSGGMKRRLSVAISLIGDPKVVYMDEPSTGLDPASRNNLWNVVKRAKQDRAIILTTHSMEEAEHLCDRLGIFVDGSLECIGNPKELKARYGGSYVFTMTTSANHEEEVEYLVRGLSPNANKIYQISGTLKFEIPKQEVRIADVFGAVENAKRRFVVHAWGIADTTLEDVFVKVAKGAQAFNVLS